jgi:hypothetical protein
MPIFPSWCYFVRWQALETPGDRGLKIFFDLRVGEPAIVQVDAKLTHGNEASRKQGAERFVDDLMLRINENVLAERLHKSQSLLARNRLIAKDAESL